MPVLKNARHERFAQEVAKGTGVAEAFKIAGFTPNPANARRLKMNETVAKRIEAILTEREQIHSRAVEKAIERTGISIESLTEDLTRIAMKAEALESGQGLNTARAAKMDIAKLNGLVIERSEIGRPGDFARMTEEELDNFIAQRARGIGGGVARARIEASSEITIESSGRVN